MSSSGRHQGVSCDACNRSNFKLRRYKCLRCFDYDLCGDCYDNKCETGAHIYDHPMQCMILPNDLDIFFPNEASGDKYSSYTCPLCGDMGFSLNTFANHVFSEHPIGHSSSKIEVICPICAISLTEDPNSQTQCLFQHLKGKHRLKRLVKSSLDELNVEKQLDSEENDFSPFSPEELPVFWFRKFSQQLHNMHRQKDSIIEKKEIDDLFAPISLRNGTLDHGSTETRSIVSSTSIPLSTNGVVCFPPWMCIPPETLEASESSFQSPLDELDPDKFNTKTATPHLYSSLEKINNTPILQKSEQTFNHPNLLPSVTNFASDCNSDAFEFGLADAINLLDVGNDNTLICPGRIASVTKVHTPDKASNNVNYSKPSVVVDTSISSRSPIISCNDFETDREESHVSNFPQDFHSSDETNSENRIILEPCMEPIITTPVINDAKISEVTIPPTQMDIFDEDWSSFLHELIWSSLQAH